MLPITRIALFTHGVALFQRSGEIEGKQNIELSFKRNEINDVLKSLTTIDMGGGYFSSLSYDSEDTTEHRLSGTNINIPQREAFSSFLDQLKGARISLRYEGNDIEGLIIGIEDIKKPYEKGWMSESHLSLLVNGDQLKKISLLEAEDIRFLDESVGRDMRDLLDTLYASLQQERKRMTIQAVGEGKREISLSYIVEAPLWKTSYRMVLPGEGSDEPFMQGWALVDNTSEEDWKGVSLSLVSGMPVSFIHDLYSPRYRRRSVVEVDDAPVAGAVMAGAGDPFAASELAEEVAIDYMEDLAAPMQKASMRSRSPAAPKRAEAMKESVKIETRTESVGDLFHYEVSQPVDIQRGRSALVPLLQESVDASRILYYREDARAEHPMSAFMLKNNTGMTLESGPLTVYDGAMYAGEAMLDTLQKDEERIVPYSVEPRVKLTGKVTHKSEASTRISKSGEYLYRYYEELRITTYEINSRLDEEKVLYLDHAWQYETLLHTEEPVEKTDQHWRFRLSIKANDTTSFAVTEAVERYEQIHIPGIADYQIHQLDSGSLLSASNKKALNVIAEHAEALHEEEEKQARLEDQRDEIEEGHERLRKNIKALGNSEEEVRLRKKYVTKLDAEEDQLEELKRQIKAIQKNIKAMKKEIETMVDGLNMQKTTWEDSQKYEGQRLFYFNRHYLYAWYIDELWR